MTDRIIEFYYIEFYSALYWEVLSETELALDVPVITFISKGVLDS